MNTLEPQLRIVIISQPHSSQQHACIRRVMFNDQGQPLMHRPIALTCDSPGELFQLCLDILKSFAYPTLDETAFMLLDTDSESFREAAQRYANR